MLYIIIIITHVHLSVWIIRTGLPFIKFTEVLGQYSNAYIVYPICESGYLHLRKFMSLFIGDCADVKVERKNKRETKITTILSVWAEWIDYWVNTPNLDHFSIDRARFNRKTFHKILNWFYSYGYMIMTMF